MNRAALLRLPETPRAEQAENKKRWNAQRDKHRADLFTIGYSGRSITEFTDLLEDAGVVTLVDVRRNPVSMYKPDFSRRNLSAALIARNIEYLHLPELGVPREVRAMSMETGDRAVIWEWYDSAVVPNFAKRNLHAFFNFADHPVALMCTEVDPTACHRHRLSIALERSGLHSYDL